MFAVVENQEPEAVQGLQSDEASPRRGGDLGQPAVGTGALLTPHTAFIMLHLTAVIIIVSTLSSSWDRTWPVLPSTNVDYVFLFNRLNFHRPH